MGEAKRKSALRPAPAAAGLDERLVGLEDIKLDDPSPLDELVLEAFKAGMSAGDPSSVTAVKAYARPDGSLRVCVIIGKLKEIIIPGDRWRELSADELLERERKRFAAGGADPSTLQLPPGHIGFMMLMPGISPSACVLPVNDFYAELKAIDQRLDEGFSGAVDPRKDLAAFAAFRKEAFDMLAEAGKTKNEKNGAVGLRMLLWASVNHPGKAAELRRMLSDAIAKYDRAGIVMQLIEYRDRVATKIGSDLSIPSSMSEALHTHKMAGVADVVYQSTDKPRQTH